MLASAVIVSNIKLRGYKFPEASPNACAPPTVLKSPLKEDILSVGFPITTKSDAPSIPIPMVKLA